MNAVNPKIWEQKQREREKYLRQMKNDKVSSGRFYKKVYTAILLAALLLPLAAFGTYFYRRRAEENAALEVSGNTITVRAGGNFQAALERAKPGDTILLESGASFVGNFNLPRKTGGEFITIRASAPDNRLPRADARIEPPKYAAVLPKISSPNAEPAIKAADGAHHYRFVAVEFGATKGGVGNIIQIGTSEEKRLEDLPHHIEFDRIFLHGSASEGQRRGIAANGRFLKIVNSYISDIKRKGEESQAIAVWSSDGNVEITNNYLEAAAENILFGGAGSPLKLVPTDCVVRGNFLNKPLVWRAEGWLVKNLFEIKNGRRITVENNLMTNNWGMGQDGTAVLFTTRADNGKATVIEDIVFSGNIVRGSANAISVFGAEGGGGRRLTIRNNLFADIDGGKWGGAGNFMKSTAWDGLVIENNTIIQTNNISTAYDAPVKNFVFRGNIIFQNEYGVAGDSTASGQTALDRFFPANDFGYNVIIGGGTNEFSTYRGKNFYPASIKQVGFVNAEAGDYRLRAASPYAGKNADGKQIGANLDARNVGNSGGGK